MSVSIDFTDVTLVSEDTYRRPDPDDPEEHDDPDDHDDHDDHDGVGERERRGEGGKDKQTYLEIRIQINCWSYQ